MLTEKEKRNVNFIQRENLMMLENSLFHGDKSTVAIETFTLITKVFRELPLWSEGARGGR